ncbi:hypothetical protein EAL2_c09380 [Peptoclostridium acidaminophilum DSM 3953]|uniref:Phage holin family protein n=1 Tax=Peptoclostridium acidaminophilum DSM 3953 TaxID=1286171 RepID=W8TJ64_PEPAC|nr:phage holin family protein [Peptoclostridium acidaminophilum]AHM56237.1 hypothetical protein EAL2_c09380 [Peptoclostridium acidaminophilum DSM 3953]
MNKFLARWIVSTLALFLAASLLKSVEVTGISAALLAAAVLGIVNMFLKPLALILTLPINILTLGLFTFVINGFMLYITSGLVPGFAVTGFWGAVAGAIVISVFNMILNSIFNIEK